MERIEVYYNSACPVCAAGIESQRCRMEGVSTAPVEWLDVHRQPGRCPEVGADLETVRERLHVRSADGSIRVGMDALVVLMKATPGQKWLGHTLELPVLKQLSRVAYNAFARLLYRWNRAQHHW